MGKRRRSKPSGRPSTLSSAPSAPSTPSTQPTRQTESRSPPAAFDPRRHLIIAGGVFLFTLGLRLLFLLSSGDRSWPHSINYEGDAVIWARAAELFARGELPDEGVPHRFYAIAYLFHWFSPTGAAPSYAAFKIAWCALSALACAVGYLTFVRHFPSRPARIATGLCAFSFGSYVLATSLNVEGLYAPLLILILAGALELLRRPTWGIAATLAVLNGLALLTREEHLVFLFASSAYLTARWWRPTGVAAVVSSPARRIAIPAVIVAGAVLLCLPYSVHATRATARYNNTTKRPPNYEAAAAAGVRWPPEARAFVDSLPAFVRGKTVEFVSQECRQKGIGAATPELTRQFLVGVFGTIPEPLATPVFIASHGPMSFALANHPESNGGFSRSALDTGGGKEPRLNLTLPRHLRTFNHGYSVGWGYIKADFSGWLVNVTRKLGHAYQGVALGFTAYNIPYGRFGERRSVDLLTPLVGHGILWQALFGALLIVGGVVLWKHDTGGLWLLVVAYKALTIVLYYGYARQAVSILPVFLLVAALGIDRVLTLGARRLPGSPARRAQNILAAAVVVAACGIDIHAAGHPPRHQILGPTRPLPQWGPDAFSANAPIEVAPEVPPTRAP